jgi:hypothetical protein
MSTRLLLPPHPTKPNALRIGATECSLPYPPRLATLAGHLIVSVAMAYLCPGCGRTFSEARGFGIHKQYCNDLEDLVSWVKRYNEDSDGSGSPKRVRNNEYPLDPEDDMLVDDRASDLRDNAELELPLVEPPMSISFSGRK